MPRTADMSHDEIFRTIIDYFTNPFKPSLPSTFATHKSNASFTSQQISFYTATAPLILFFLFVPLACALLHTRISADHGPRSPNNPVLKFARDIHFYIRRVFGYTGDSSGDATEMITLVDVGLELGLIVLVLVFWRIAVIAGGYGAMWVTKRLAEEEMEGGDGDGEEVYGMGMRGFGKYVVIKDGERAMEEREKLLTSLDLEDAKSVGCAVEGESLSDNDTDDDEEEGVERVSGLTAMSLCL